MSAPVLAVEGLEVGYEDLVVVRDVGLTVQEGEICLLRGRNGAGKTTLLTGISGLLPSRAGTVLLRDADVTALPAHARARRGLCFVQAGKRVFRELTVRDNILVGVLGSGTRRREVTAVIDRTCDRFPLLASRLAERAGALSGGQQQLLAIAQALAANPQILLLDEPSSGLSPKAVHTVTEAIAGLKAEGLAILLVEELVDDAYAGIADRLVVLDEGRVLYDGDVASVSRERMITMLDMGDVSSRAVSGQTGPTSSVHPSEGEGR